MSTPQPSFRPIGLTPELFTAVFQFHFVVGPDLRLCQFGKALAKACPDVAAHAWLPELIRPLRPVGELTFQWLKENQRQLFLLQHIGSGLQLRGQILMVNDDQCAIFLGSPWLTEAAQIGTQPIDLEDYPIHDAAVDLLHALQAQKVALQESKVLATKLTEQRTELRTANARLRQQEAEQRKLALIAARTDNSVVLTDAAGKVIWVNNGFTRLTGYTLEDMLGRKPGHVLQGRGTDPVTVHHIRQQLDRGEGFSAEILNYGKAGNSYWVSTEVQPICDEHGGVVNFMAIQSNVTERRAAQQRLSLQSEVSHVLAAADDLQLAAPDVLRAIGTTLTWQAGILWRTAGDHLEFAAGWSESPADAGEFIDACRHLQFAPGCDLPGRVLTSRTPIWLADFSREPDCLGTRKTGAKDLRSALAFPIFAQGQCWGVLEFLNRRVEEPDEQLLRTLSLLGHQLGQFVERTLAEQLLRATNALQRAILEGANYSIISTDPGGTIRLFNAAAERMLGYAAAEVVAKSTPGIFHDTSEVAVRAAELTAELGRVVHPGFDAFVAKAELGHPDEREWTYLRKDGSRFPVLLSVTALFDNRGKLSGYLGIASDLTARKRDEEKLRTTLSELERFNRIMLNREQRVLELKAEVNQLLAELGRPSAFQSVRHDSSTDGARSSPGRDAPAETLRT